jgi:hypothetical protein
MPVPTNPQTTQAAIAVLTVIAAGLCVAHWRRVLQVIVVVVIALALFGAVEGLGMTTLMAQHHR